MSNPTNRLVLNLIETIIGWATDDPKTERIHAGIQMLSNESSNSNLPNSSLPDQVNPGCTSSSSCQHQVDSPVAFNKSSIMGSTQGFDALLDAANIRANEINAGDNASSSIASAIDSVMRPRGQGKDNANQANASLHSPTVGIELHCFEDTKSCLDEIQHYYGRKILHCSHDSF